MCSATRPVRSCRARVSTSYELSRAGIDTTLICDNMASIVMKNGWIQACFVGCDRVAANGDTANKIGTSGVAILAKHYGIPFYVLGPTSTIDLSCATGDDITIELRDPAEIRAKFYREPMAPDRREVATTPPSTSPTTALITGHRDRARRLPPARTPRASPRRIPAGTTTRRDHV